MSSQRELTEDESKELESLTEAVHSAIEARGKWIDNKMVECSELKIGDDIYDIDSGVKLGVVSKMYRYWQHYDYGVHDDSHRCDYEYEVSKGCFDNTSRQMGLEFGTLDDAIKRQETKAEILQYKKDRNIR